MRNGVRNGVRERERTGISYENVLSTWGTVPLPMGADLKLRGVPVGVGPLPELSPGRWRTGMKYQHAIGGILPAPAAGAGKMSPMACWYFIPARHRPGEAECRNREQKTGIYSYRIAILRFCICFRAFSVTESDFVGWSLRCPIRSSMTEGCRA